MDKSEFLQKTILLQQRQYQIQHLLGEGSHATVWCARERFYPHQEITIKIARDIGGIAHERVQNEIWFLKEIRHPHIPEFLGEGFLNQHLWLAMPMFQSLRLSFSNRGNLQYVMVSDISPKGYPQIASAIPLKYREKMAVAVLSDISKVIEYIAGTGIVHADISPSNIMEKGTALNRQYVLTDWGASALIHRYPENSFGSLHFTAPERLLGNVGHKSDLFSLGVTCFYIVTGTVPYCGTNGEQYYLNTVERDGIAPSDFVDRVFSPLDRLIRDMIHHHVEQRPEPRDICKKIEKIRPGLQ